MLPEKMEQSFKGLQFLEGLITSDYIIGDHVTLADMCLITNVASFFEVMAIDVTK